MTSYDEGVNNTTNMEHMGLMSNPNGYITPEDSSMAVSPASDLTECHVGSEVSKIGNKYNPDQNLVGPQMSSQNYVDNYGLLNGDLTAMQEQSYVNWFENINGMMIPSYSDSFYNTGSDEDFWLLQHQLLNNGSFWIGEKRFY